MKSINIPAILRLHYVKDFSGHEIEVKSYSQNLIFFRRFSAVVLYNLLKRGWYQNLQKKAFIECILTVRPRTIKWFEQNINHF